MSRLIPRVRDSTPGAAYAAEMRAVLLLCAIAACAAPVDPDRPALRGRASDPTFCVNVEADGRRYTANDAPPTPAQSAAGVMKGRYPYPAQCEYEPD